jgi:purine-cytosine permease-like protein
VIGGIGFIAAGTGLGWLSAGADYARYLPRTAGSGRIAGATVLGSAVPLVVLISMGALMAVGDGGLAAASDPVAAIGAALPGWMLVPYLDTTTTSRYRYAGGVHIPAVAARILAIAAGLICTHGGPLAGTWIGRNSLGWLVAGVTAAVLYAGLRPVVRRPAGPESLHV